MLKRISLVLPFLVCFFIIFSGCNFTKDVELNVQTPEPQHLSLLFAADIDENEEPIGENYQFEDGESFYIFFNSNLPFGQDNFVITINEIDDNNEYQLYDQGELSIDPGWDTGYVYFTLPTGHYDIEVYFHDGLSVGREIIIN